MIVRDILYIISHFFIVILLGIGTSEPADSDEEEADKGRAARWQKSKKTSDVQMVMDVVFEDQIDSVTGMPTRNRKGKIMQVKVHLCHICE
jgi:hypothetical protein